MHKHRISSVRETSKPRIHEVCLVNSVSHSQGWRTRILMPGNTAPEARSMRTALLVWIHFYRLVYLRGRDRQDKETNRKTQMEGSHSLARFSYACNGPSWSLRWKPEATTSFPDAWQKHNQLSHDYCFLGPSLVGSWIQQPEVSTESRYLCLDH